MKHLDGLKRFYNKLENWHQPESCYVGDVFVYDIQMLLKPPTKPL